MQIVYVLQAQGYGDNELAFANVGVYDSMQQLEKTKQALQTDDATIVFNVEEFMLNA